MIKLQNKEATTNDLVELLEGLVTDWVFNRGDAWEILIFYRHFVSMYPEYIDFVDYRAPQDDPDIGFRFILDDDNSFLELEYDADSESWTWYFRNRKKGNDAQGKINNLKEVKVLSS